MQSRIPSWGSLCLWCNRKHHSASDNWVKSTLSLSFAVPPLPPRTHGRAARREVHHCSVALVRRSNTPGWLASSYSIKDGWVQFVRNATVSIARVETIWLVGWVEWWRLFCGTQSLFLDKKDTNCVSRQLLTSSMLPDGRRHLWRSAGRRELSSWAASLPRPIFSVQIFVEALCCYRYSSHTCHSLNSYLTPAIEARQMKQIIWLLKIHELLHSKCNRVGAAT